MIKITMSQGEESREFSFSHKVITIGETEGADIVLPTQLFDGQQLTITPSTDGTDFTIDNSVTLPILVNGSPCTQHTLSNGDTLQVGNVTLAVTLETNYEDFDVEAELDKLSGLFNEDGLINDDVLDNLDLDALTAEVAQLDIDNEQLEQELQEVAEDFEEEEEEEQPSAEEVAEAEAEEEQKAEEAELAAITLKFHPETSIDSELRRQEEPPADYSAFEDDESAIEAKEESWSKEVANYDYTDEAEGSLTRRFTAVALILITMTAVIGTGSYLTVSHRNQEQEKLAAQGLCDIAMALSYAQLNDRLPPEGRWKDHEFIEENMALVLSSRYRAQSQLNSSGALRNCDYTVQMGYDSDHSRTLITAVPKKGLIQWLMPKRSLFVELPSMRVYRTAVSGNELLTARKAVSVGGQDTDLAWLLRKSEVLTLNSLTVDHVSEGFTPPLELATLAPGAQTRIYNAPRYYKFTKPFMQAVTRLSEGSVGARERALLDEQLKKFSNLADLVYYSSKGATTAAAARQALTELHPDLKLTLGYVNFSHEDGLIADCGLLGPRETAETLTTGDPSLPTPTAIASEGNMREQLFALAENRRTAITEAGNALTELIKKQSVRPTATYHQQYDHLRKQLEAVQEEQEVKVAKAVEVLYQQWTSDNPQSKQQFVALLDETGLNTYLPTASAPNSSTISPTLAITATTVDTLLSKVDGATSFEGLGSAVDRMMETITTEGAPDPERMLAIENRLRTRVLNKVSEFLLSPQDTPSPQMFQAKSRTTLSKVLTTAGITESDERDFYLREFDLLMERFRAASAEEVLTESPEAEKAVDHIVQQASQIPLDEILAADNGSDPRTYARLGQQILAQESRQRPSPQRDENLHQAISLLSKAVDDNRNYWQDILEARRMLTERPKLEIAAILRSPLGFSNNVTPAVQTIRDTLQSYLDAALQIDSSTTSHSNYDLLRREQGPKLRQMLAQAQSLQRDSQRLLSSFDSYTSRLEEYAADYTKAKEAGFFTAAPQYHPRMLSQLRRQLRQSADLRQQLVAAARQIGAAGQAYETIARSAIQQLNNPGQLTARATQRLEQDAAKARFPAIAGGSLARDMASFLEYEVSPNPKQG